MSGPQKYVVINPATLQALGTSSKQLIPAPGAGKVIDIISELKSYNINVNIFDPWVSEEDAVHEYGLSLTNSPNNDEYDAVIVAVAHNEFIEKGPEGIRNYLRENGLFYDLKSLFAKDKSDIRL